MVDFSEYVKRVRRILDGNFSNRKTILIILGCLAVILYILPNVFRILFFKPQSLDVNDFSTQGLESRLGEYIEQVEERDINILHEPPRDEKRFTPYIGNGYLGLSVDSDSQIFIRNGRSLSLAIPYRPITLVNLDGWSMKEAIVSQYRSGTVTRYQFWESAHYGMLEVSYQMYAHRSNPAMFIQNIKITNPTDKDIIVEVEQLGLMDWATSSSEIIKMQHGNGEHEYVAITGTISIPGSTRVIPVAVVTLNAPQSLQVKPRVTKTLHITTAVNYSESINPDNFLTIKKVILSAAMKDLKDTVMGNPSKFRSAHVSVWEKLWLSGFSISHSKAENTLNGDAINATIYNVLSQVRAPLYEATTPPLTREKLLTDLAYAEGCYGGPATLQASRLWSNLQTIEDVNSVVNVWLMTLEKQGCHQLLRTGADGVMQAMLLSFGGLQFKNQHLEFNVDPQHLHRDYLFRRLNYGNGTHLNISVNLQEEDYKAVIQTALDRSDKNYYACDAGCMDSIKQLGSKPVLFPVKRTHPLTAILYITADKSHLEVLKHTIHVHEIAVAPAHEHHVIALHRHGNKWGGLPTVFWLSIILLIVVFHLFLFKLVFNEYCGPDVRVRYRKLSDF